MNSIDLLILDGPPAVGKSSIAKAMAEKLKACDICHAVIEMDELARVFPSSLMEVMYKNLAAIWPNYEVLGDIKIIIPTYMQAGELELVADAAPAKRTTICEVVAPYEESVERITKREINEADRQRHIDYIKGYSANKTPEDHITFRVINSARSVEDAAQEILDKLGWLSSPAG